jgi:hypothetical protein
MVGTTCTSQVDGHVVPHLCRLHHACQSHASPQILSPGNVTDLEVADLAANTCMYAFVHYVLSQHRMVACSCAVGFDQGCERRGFWEPWAVVMVPDWLVMLCLYFTKVDMLREQ